VKLKKRIEKKVSDERQVPIRKVEQRKKLKKELI
jgi:hypothetical protein